jgi:hypothetical protein
VRRRPAERYVLQLILIPFLVAANTPPLCAQTVPVTPPDAAPPPQPAGPPPDEIGFRFHTYADAVGGAAFGVQLESWW